MAGNYVTGLMTYVNVNNDYSRFELDNLQRWLTWQYLDLSNFIVSRIASSPHIRATTTPPPRRRRAPRTRISSPRRAAINVQLAPEAYQAVRSNPADFNQAIHDYVATYVGDRGDEMTGAISAAGIHGLEG
jgi:hypothetical protein